MKTPALFAAFALACILTGCAAPAGSTTLSPAQQAAVDKLGATVVDDLTVLAAAENAKLLQKLGPAASPAKTGLAK